MFSSKLLRHLVILAVAGSLAAPLPAVAGGKIHGKSVAEWSAAWWQWAAIEPINTSPMFAEGEVDCSLNQSGPVWFLAGTVGGAVERSCSIPRGRSLFFPLVNVTFWYPEDGATVEELRAIGAGASDPLVTPVECTLDGVPCVYSYEIVRVQSPVFTLDIAEGSVFNEFGYDPGPRYPTIADGWWVMLDPLPPGTHALHFAAGVDLDGDGAPDFSVELDHELTVGP